jgi:hypothetical protein
VERRTLAAAASGAVLLAAGCGGGHDDARRQGGRASAASAPAGPPLRLSKEAMRRPFTEPEKLWLARFRGWWVATQPRAQDVLDLHESDRARSLLTRGDRAAVDDLGAWLPTLRQCLSTFRHGVGPAPSPRLRQAARLVGAACTHFSAAAAADARGLQSRDPAGFVVAFDELRKGFAELGVGEELLQPRSDARALPAVDRPSRVSRIQTRYSEVATRLEGTPVEVRCWSRRDWPRVEGDASVYSGEPSDPQGELGFVLFGNRANLAPDVCSRLDRLTYSGARPRGGAAIDLGEAVIALAHEAEHVGGVHDEAEAECDALQLAPRTARLLGAGRGYGELLAARFRLLAYPLLPAEYRSAECRPAGRLDLRLADGWPALRF